MTDIFEKQLLNKVGISKSLPSIQEDKQLPDIPCKKYLTGREHRAILRQQKINFAKRIEAQVSHELKK